MRLSKIFANPLFVDFSSLLFPGLLCAALISIIYFSAGCSFEGRFESVPVQQQSVQQQSVLKLLPTGCKNLTDLGNDWYTFDLEIKGSGTRKFLLRWRKNDTEGHDITITEIVHW